MKLGLAAATLALVAAGAVGCSDDGDGGGDDSTSTAEFCGALQDFQSSFSDSDPTTDLPGYIKTLKDAADKLDEVGTPEGIPDDAEDGFDLTIDRIGDIPDDATLDDLTAFGDLNDADQKKSDALDDYIDEECPDLTEDSSPSVDDENASPGPSPSS
jgi:hypothetical protein